MTEFEPFDPAALAVEDWPAHGTFPAFPAGTTFSACAGCHGCPQVGAAGHATQGEYALPSDLPDNVRIRLSTLRLLQWLAWHSAVRHGLIGWTPGWQVPSAHSYNYADATPWTLVSGSGTTVVLQAPEGNDPRRLQLWAGTTINPELGFGTIRDNGGWHPLMPNGILQFSMPSVLALKSRPSIVRILGCNVGARTYTLEVDRDCTHAGTTVGGVPGPVTVGVWYEAGAPARWMEDCHVWPDPAGTRCKWARIDHSASLGNLPAVPGVVVDGDGKHWYCAKRWAKTSNISYDDDPDGSGEWVHTWSQPSALGTFPANGRCAQTGCDQYEPLGGSAWLTRDDGGQVLQQILAGVDTRLRRPYGATLPSQWSLQRAEAAGILTLLGQAGVPSLMTPPMGMEERVEVWRSGGHGPMVVWSDVTGDHVRVTAGAGWDWFGSVSWASPPGPGALGSVEHHDALDYATTRDGRGDETNWPERLGCRWTLDGGDPAGRPVARWSHALADEPVIAPALLADAPAHGLRIDYCARGVAHVRLSTPVSGWGGYLQISPYRQPAKVERSIGTRTVRAVVGLSGGLVAVDLEHHHWVAVGSTIEEVRHEWYAGGGPLTPAPAWAAPLNRAIGGDVGHADGALMRGDTVSFSAGSPDLALGVNWSDRRFIVQAVAPHGSTSAAADWGPWPCAEPAIAVVAATDYADHALKYDRLVLTDERGMIASGVVPGATLTGWWSAAYWVPVTALWWTPYGVDDWQLVPVEYWLSDHSSGRVWISEAWYALHDPAARICLKA